MLKEIWKDVPEWENFYQVSNLGRARNKKTGKLKPLDENNYGYFRLQCYDGENRKKLFIHRLVATLFVEGFVEGYAVNHKDGDKSNNTSENLEWVSASNNCKHCYETKLREGKYSKVPSKLTTSDGTEIFFESLASLAKSIGLTPKRVDHLLKTQNGFIPEINAYISKCVSND